MSMMLDRLLENWDSFAHQYRDPDKLYDRIGPFTWGGIRSLLRQALVFDIENVEEFIQQAKGGHLTEHDYPNVMPVAPVMWLEWTNRSQTESGLTFAVSGRSADMGNALSYGVLIASYGPDETGDVQNIMFTFVSGRGDKFLFCGAYGYRCDSQGVPLGVQAMSTTVKALESSNPEQFRGTMRCWFGTPFMALSFMHCKNVTANKRQTPKRKVTVSGSGKRKAPYVKCYTLQIEPMKQVLRTEGQIEKSGIKHALHICRGHFKDYSKGNGLFGKYQGLYWWDSHTRGSVEVGIVAKDYMVMGPKH